MIILLVLALTLSTPLPSSLLTNTSALASTFQQKCVQILPKNFEHHTSLASLVCGEKITDAELKENLSKTSLIHIFVISGSHLILLDELLSIFKIPVIVRFLFLGSYSLVSGWQAPAVRAFLGLGLREVFRRRHLHLPADLGVLATGFTTLILFPGWWNSLSLQMSWCAALALSTSSALRIKNAFARAVFSQVAIFFFMSAPLWGLGSLHPLSILYNLFLAPVVSYILLPLSFLAAAFSPFLILFEKVMGFFNDALIVLSEPIEIHKRSLPSVGLLWTWILGWHCVMHFLRLHLWQGKDAP
ncbi:ComEC/Rec2 family competence protein [Bdellovibrio sp. BCCA]|uniref:ComEC/Rec2 family competence protein n=1 Tax=Bdellovibrio sp. BCCA TaxID=3136281 RepID=UPI0030F07279